jgi:tetratricopeptide (TPR) repeat protein
MTLAKIELTNGRWAAANRELESAARLDAGSALEHRSLLALTYFLGPPRAELLSLRDSLEHLEEPLSGTIGDGLIRIHRQVRPYLRPYLLGLLSARLGDDTTAQRYATELQRVDSSSATGRFAYDQAQVLLAEVARIRGRPQEALATLERARFWTRTRSGTRPATRRSSAGCTSGLPARSCCTNWDVMTRRSPGTGA